MENSDRFEVLRRILKDAKGDPQHLVDHAADVIAILTALRRDPGYMPPTPGRKEAPAGKGVRS